MCSTKIKASTLPRMFCLVVLQAQHFADGQETHVKTENKSKPVLEIQESTWKIFTYLFIYFKAQK